MLSVNGFPQANMFDQPDLEALLRANLKQLPEAELRGDVEVTEIVEDDQGRVHVTFTDRPTGARAPRRGRLRPRLRRRQQHYACIDRLQTWKISDSSSAGWSSTSRPRPTCDQWEGVHQVCDPVPRRHLHAHRADPLSVGVPTAAPARRADDFGTLTALGP